VLPENLELEILYEDEHVVVLDKKQGMVVHPAKGNYSGTVVNGLLYHFQDLRNRFPEPEIRPGIVHRLDKDTSGVLIAARNRETHAFLTAEFREKKVKKLYTALVKGAPRQDEGVVETGIQRDPGNRKRFTWCREGGKQAITRYRVLTRWNNYSLLTLKPGTGRTHQLRVHCRYLGCPVLGDPIYSRKDTALPEATLMLHASRLAIRLPHTGTRIFKSPLPVRFHKIIGKLGNPSP
jgi:23S rRNA pseudouridine1911/1915/1917 synthase